MKQVRVISKSFSFALKTSTALSPHLHDAAPREAGKGRVVPYSAVPHLRSLRQSLPQFFGPKADALYAEVTPSRIVTPSSPPSQPSHRATFTTTSHAAASAFTATARGEKLLLCGWAQRSPCNSSGFCAAPP